MSGLLCAAICPKHGRISQDLILVQDGRSETKMLRAMADTRGHRRNQSGVAAVIDGMGGHPRGRLAAAILATAFTRSGLDSSTREHIEHSIESAHHRMQTISARMQLAKCMGAAVGGLAWSNGTYVAFGAGDIEIIQLVDGKARQLIAKERTSRGGLFNCVGGEFGGNVYVQYETVRPAGCVVIASDGAWEASSYRTWLKELLDGAGVLEDVAAVVRRGSEESLDDASLIVMSM